MDYVAVFETRFQFLRPSVVVVVSHTSCQIMKFKLGEKKIPIDVAADVETRKRGVVLLSAARKRHQYRPSREEEDLSGGYIIDSFFYHAP